MKRIILTTSGFGKTYLDNICSNIYDFDKHTLGCKYCRELYQSISDEEFKGMPNRVLNKEFPSNLFCKFNNFFLILFGYLVKIKKQFFFQIRMKHVLFFIRGIIKKFKKLR